jgi:hypothetical protein
MLINLQKICYLDKIRPAGGDICIKRSPFLLVRGGINILLEDGRVRRRTESVLQAWINFCSRENRFVICKNLMCTLSAFCPRQFSNLGCTSARKVRLGRKTVKKA